MTDTAVAPTPRLLRRREVEHITSLSRTSIYRRMGAGTFPASIRVGEQTTVWVEAEVLAWIDAQIAASRGEGRAV